MSEYEALIKSLRTPSPRKTPVILPDFFLDHFVFADDFDSFVANLETLAMQGGGNLMGTQHMVRRGGNSANTASALYRLGLEPVLIVTTDFQGKRLLESLMPSGFNLNHVHTDGRLSATVSIELEYEGRPVNLMVSDSGSASSFGFDCLDERDLNAVAASDLVCLLNLNHNTKGVELARYLFEYVRSQGNALTIMDTGDPSGRPDFLKSLLKQVVHEGLVDVLAMNENEASWYACALDKSMGDRKETLRNPSKWISMASFVSRETGVQIELHTPFYSASIRHDEICAIPAFEVHPRILCGAGDSWNAGSIYGFLAEISTQDRLTLANAIAALYVSMGTGEHPTKEGVIEFLQSQPSPSIYGTKLLKPNSE